MRTTIRNLATGVYQLGITFSMLLTFQIVQATDSPFFSNLSIRDGLPSNIITAIAQDKHDFIWIGTESGLARYDGYDFKIFKKTESPNSLPYNMISALLPRNDHIWVGTWNGLCKINSKTFEIERIDLGPGRAIRALYKGKDNTVWIGTGNGLILYDANTDTYSLFNTLNSGLSHNTVRAIYEDHQGTLWVGTYDGLNQLKPGANNFGQVSLRTKTEDGPANHLILDIREATSQNELWVGSETGLYLLNTETGSSRHYNEEKSGFSNEVIKCIYQSENGNLWLGTDFGLNIFNSTWETNSAHFHNPQLPYSLANNVIWQIFEDRSGVIWLVTSNGLSKINKSGSFYDYTEVSFEVDDQLTGNQVKTILTDSKGNYWLGTQHGVVKTNPKTGKQEIFDTSSPLHKRILLNNVFALEEDVKGNIWIGTAGGINVWDGQKMHAVTANDRNGLTSNYIAKFVQGPDGYMWVSAWEGGLFKTSGTLDNLYFTPVPGLEGSAMFVAGSGYLWAIEFDELYRIDPESLEKKHIPSFGKATGKQMIYSLFCSKAGNLWAGTLNGLVAYAPGTKSSLFYPLRTGNDMIVSSIMEDRQGNIWSSSSKSLQKLSPADEQIEIYPLDQGLPLKNFYSGCAARTETGEILFGGDNGYITFYPDKAQPNRFNPSVYITSIEINHKKISVREQVDGEMLLPNDIAFMDELTLNYGQRSVTFDFSSLHFWQPSMNVYAYRLKGLENDWNYVSGMKNFAVYSSLPSGSYELQVKATNNYGVQSENTAQLAITIKPPIYLSPLFIGLYVIVAGAAIFYGLRFYSARVHLKNELKIIKMEKAHAEEIERTKEEFFTNISHELRTPISLILPPIHEIQKKGNLDNDNSQLIALAEKNSVRLLRLVNQILDFNKLENETLQIKVSKVDLVAFCKDVATLFSDQACRNEITFGFNSSHGSYEVWIDAEKIETVLFNLLSNAFKFTPKGGKILLSINVDESSSRFKEGSFDLEICDTGIGISEEAKSRIFERFYQSPEGKKMNASSGIGLTLAAEYIELHHGNINVESTVGKGTTFTIHLPLGRSHLPIDSVTDNEISLLATRSLYAPTQRSRSYHLDLESDKPMILIIEDNNDMVEFIRTSLGHKFNFVVAENGEEGLVKADNFMPEVIISDIMMPVMDGLAMCKKVKENPKTSHITIILLTAKSLDSQRLEGIRVGADVYVTKPFEIDLLEAHINNLITRKKELNHYFRTELVNQQDTPEAKDNVDNKFIKRVMDIIEANISDPELSVEMISHEIGVSSTHLYRKMKALTDRSPQDVIKKYRIKKASLLLQNNEGNVSETMYKVGFSSLSYFSKCFKAEFRMTPREYQQQTAEKKVEVNTVLKIDG